MFIALPVSEILVFIFMIFTTLFLLLGTSGEVYAHSGKAQTEKVIVVTHAPSSYDPAVSFVYGKEKAKATPVKNLFAKPSLVLQVFRIHQNETVHHFSGVREYLRRGPPAVFFI